MWLDRLLGRIGWRSRPKPSHGPNLQDPFEQLRAVEAATFTKKKVMHLREYRVFQLVEEEARNLQPKARVFAQTALGEIIRSDDRAAYKAINSKRTDIVIIGAAGFALAAVEYQGGGHYNERAATKDAVKREALRRAGVEYVEVTEAHSESEIRERIRSALRIAGRAINRPTSAWKRPDSPPAVGAARETRNVGPWGLPQTNGAPEGAPTTLRIGPAAQTE